MSKGTELNAIALDKTYSMTACILTCTQQGLGGAGV